MADEIHFHTLTELMYTEPEKGGDYRLYLFDAEGLHSGSQWFTSGAIRYPDEQIEAHRAQIFAEEWIKRGLEVRITDGGDRLVFHLQRRPPALRPGRLLEPNLNELTHLAQPTNILIAAK